MRTHQRGALHSVSIKRELKSRGGVLLKVVMHPPVAATHRNW